MDRDGHHGVHGLVDGVDHDAHGVLKKTRPRRKGEQAHRSQEWGIPRRLGHPLRLLGNLRGAEVEEVGGGIREEGEEEGGDVLGHEGPLEDEGRESIRWDIRGP